MSDPNFAALQDEAETLRLLASQKPTPARVRHVKLALRSKWEGNRSLAAQALAAWGRHEFVPLLKEVLDESLAGDTTHSSFLRVVSDSLAMLVEPEDKMWLGPLLKNNGELFWQLGALQAKHDEFTSSKTS